MSNKVMVAVDGSEKDGRGLSIALAMANVLDAAVHLVRAVDDAGRGQGGLKQLVFGSVAKGVVRAADVPVLLLTPTMLAADTTAEREESRATR